MVRKEKMVRKENKLFNSKGQMVVETVLLMVVLLFFMNMFIKFLKKQEVAKSFTSKPWSVLSGMVECGQWKECGADKGGVHPNSYTRMLSLSPKED